MQALFIFDSWLSNKHILGVYTLGNLGCGDISKEDILLESSM